MPATALDSAIFRDIFGTEAMRQVWSDGNRVQKYLDFEAGLARAQATLKIIPQEACDEIQRHGDAAAYDFELLKTQTERIGYPILPVVQQMVAKCRDGLGEWCHWGATTQDITDTATIMQIRDGLAIIEMEINEISDALAALAKKYRDTPMAGRSNLQQAVPITFGYKCATYLAAFERRHGQVIDDLLGQAPALAERLAGLEHGDERAVELEQHAKAREAEVSSVAQVRELGRQLDIGQDFVDAAIAEQRAKANRKPWWQQQVWRVRLGIGAGALVVIVLLGQEPQAPWRRTLTIGPSISTTSTLPPSAIR